MDCEAEEDFRKAIDLSARLRSMIEKESARIMEKRTA
jgi:hypothetical protein